MNAFPLTSTQSIPHSIPILLRSGRTRLIGKNCCKQIEGTRSIILPTPSATCMIKSDLPMSREEKTSGKGIVGLLDYTRRCCMFTNWQNYVLTTIMPRTDSTTGSSLNFKYRLFRAYTVRLRLCMLTVSRNTFEHRRSDSLRSCSKQEVSPVEHVCCPPIYCIVILTAL
jgi:hypothetical protein